MQEPRPGHALADASLAARRRGHNLGRFEDYGDEWVAACVACGRRAFVLVDGSFEGAAFVGRCPHAQVDEPAEIPEEPVPGEPVAEPDAHLPLAADDAREETTEIPVDLEEEPPDSPPPVRADPDPPHGPYTVEVPPPQVQDDVATPPGIFPRIKSAGNDTLAEEPAPVLPIPAVPAREQTPDPVSAVTTTPLQRKARKRHRLPVSLFLLPGIRGRHRIVRRDDGERDRTLLCSCRCMAWATSEEPWQVAPCEAHRPESRQVPETSPAKGNQPPESQPARLTVNQRKRLCWFSTLVLTQECLRTRAEGWTELASTWGRRLGAVVGGEPVYVACALICLAPFTINSFDDMDIATWAGLKTAFVRPRTRRLREQGIWKREGKRWLVTSDFDRGYAEPGGKGDVELVLHALCANGEIHCVRDEPQS